MIPAVHNRLRSPCFQAFSVLSFCYEHSKTTDNQTTAEGVIGANATLNVLNADPAKGIVAAGFDAGTPQKEAINAGQLLGSVTQSPLMMGYECIKTLYAIANGETVKDIPMNGYWYDTTNMADDNIAPNLYD